MDVIYESQNVNFINFLIKIKINPKTLKITKKKIHKNFECLHTTTNWRKFNTPDDAIMSNKNIIFIISLIIITIGTTIIFLLLLVVCRFLKLIALINITFFPIKFLHAYQLIVKCSRGYNDKERLKFKMWFFWLNLNVKELLEN